MGVQVPNQDEFDALVARVAALEGGQPISVDCVLSDWRLDSAGPWSTCQPDGTQHRSETWVRDVVTPPANGGALCGPTTEQRIGHQPCVYVPPSAGVLVYHVQIETHEHFFTDAAEMKVWVPLYKPRIPEPVPCSIEWKGYDGAQHRHEFVGFDAFKAFIAVFVPAIPPIITPVPGELAFPGQQDWRSIWPDYDPSDLSQAPAGLMTGDGFPERRALVEGNWWFAPSGDLNHARHNHIGACVPDVARGIFDIFVVARQFHWNGQNVQIKGIISANIEEKGCRYMMPATWSEKQPGLWNLPVTEHLQVNWLPVRIDSRAALTDGRKNLTLRLDVYRPSDGIHHLITLQVPITLDNGNREVKHTGGTTTATGWMTELVTDPVTGKTQELNDFGYQEAVALGWNPDNANDNSIKGTRRFVDDVQPRWYVRGGADNAYWPLEVLVTKNPNFHLHPKFDGSDPQGVAAFEGEVLIREALQERSSQFFPVDAAPFGVNDRMVVRVADRKRLTYVWATNPETGERKAGNLRTIPSTWVIDEANPITLTDPEAVTATVLAISMGKAQ